MATLPDQCFLGPDLPCKVLSCDLKLSQTDDRRMPSLICTLQVVCSIHCIVYIVAPPIYPGPCLSCPTCCRWDSENTWWGYLWQGGLLWRQVSELIHQCMYVSCKVLQYKKLGILFLLHLYPVCEVRAVCINIYSVWLDWLYVPADLQAVR